MELASRLEEARTSAKLLEQVVMNTPPTEMLQNELIREFANRCLSASRSIQGYMASENPSPDNDTMESLIDTNEQLQTALNQHQRAVLGARKQLGLGTASHEGSPGPEADGPARHESWQASSALFAGAVASGANGKGKQVELNGAPGGPPPSQASGSRDQGDARADKALLDASGDAGRGSSSNALGQFRFALAQEPFSPGFQLAKSGGDGREAVSWDAPGASGQQLQAARGRRAAAVARNDDDDDDDDIYEATPKSKEPGRRL